MHTSRLVFKCSISKVFTTFNKMYTWSCTEGKGEGVVGKIDTERQRESKHRKSTNNMVRQREKEKQN